MPGNVFGVEAQAPITPSTGPANVKVPTLEGVGERVEEKQPLTSMQSALAVPPSLQLSVTGERDAMALTDLALQDLAASFGPEPLK